MNFLDKKDACGIIKPEASQNRATVSQFRMPEHYLISQVSRASKRSRAKLTVFLMVLLTTTMSEAVTPPAMVIEDRVGVNVASGKPSFKVNDLKIGLGALSLSHTISSYAGYFYGYHDIFGGGIHQATIVRPNSNDSFQTMKVTAMGGTVNFKINPNGTYLDYKLTGEKLVKQGSKYLYTKKDGTEIKFGRLFMEQVKYPNGFTIEVHRSGHRIQSVNTNNGLQFKWVYSRDTVPTLGTSTTVCIPYLVSSCQDDPDLDDYFYRMQQREMWKYNFPTKIVAINNAVEYCTSGFANCTIGSDWPSSEYVWNNQMPDAIFSGQTDFTVKEMSGKSTKYRHQAYDTSLDNSGLYFQPRVDKILDGNTNAVIADYSYVNKPSCQSFRFYVSCQTGSELSLTKIVKSGMEWGYSIGENGVAQGRGVSNTGLSGPGRVTVRMDSYYGVPVEVFSNGTFYSLGYNEINRLYQTNTDGYISKYYYDSRGNLKKREDIGKPGTAQAGQKIVTEAGYPSSCTNYKTCNKSLWDKDGRGNITNYVYHEDSGQLSRVTYSANRSGVRAQTRYKYAQFYARYKKTSNTIEQADTPIWLVTEESYCISGAANAPATGQISSSSYGCSIGSGDEVKTTFEYGTGSSANNLFLKGKAVTADGKTYRTCYENDKYGNKIGETKPLGVTGTCS